MEKKWCDSYSTTSTNHCAQIGCSGKVSGETNRLTHILQPQSTYSSNFSILKSAHSPHGK